MSVDPVRARYAEVSYPGNAFAQTHPARHAAIARLLGRPAADVRTARVLELGCAQGYNLLPLAAHWPQAQFVGLDFSAQEIARGRALAEAAGLSNVAFVAGDLRTYAPPPGSFDYIIAHGVLSWVPDDTKAALFALCSRALAPHGVAYISYNTYPGWKHREAVRELMLLQIGGATSPADRLAAARRSLDTLDRLLVGRPESHAALTREIVATMRRKQPGHFYHDDLDGVNDPCYFLQFAAWASEHGLAYLGEAEWETMFAELLPPSAGAALRAFGADRLQLEQELDYLRNRSFRCSLLVAADGPAPGHPDPVALRTCSFGTNLRPPIGLPPLAVGTTVHFGGASPRAFSTSDPVAKAMFVLLADAWPQRVPFPSLLAGVRRLLDQHGLTPPGELEHTLLGRLLDACGRRFVDFLADLSFARAAEVPAAPQAHPLTRLMAAQALPIVNRWHESVPLDDATRALLATLDGRRTDFTAAERQQLSDLAAASLLELQDVSPPGLQGKT